MGDYILIICLFAVTLLNAVAIICILLQKMPCCKNKGLLLLNLSVAQIAEKLGFNSDRYFSARFRRAMGITAVQFRKQRQVDKYE